MRWIGVTLTIGLLLLSGCSRSEEVACALPAEIEAEFAALPALNDFTVGYEERMAPRRALAEKYPDNLLVQLRVQEAWQETPWLSAEWDRLLEQYESLPGGDLLRASLLVEAERDESRETLEKILGRRPDHPWAHFAIMRWASARRHRDVELLEKHVRQFRQACPENPEAFRFVALVDKPELQAQAAGEGQRLLAGKTDDRSLNAWHPVWKLMLFSNEGDYADTEQRIREQVQTIERMNRLESPAWVRAVVGGYRLVSDEESQRQFEDRILAERPESANAYWIANERWSREGIRETARFKEERLAQRRAIYENAKSQHERWPNAPAPLYQMITLALRRAGTLPGIPLEEKLRAIDDYIGMIEPPSDIRGLFLEARFMAAAFYLREGVRVERVPGLVEAAMADRAEALRYLGRSKPELKSELGTNDQDVANGVMLRYYEITEQPEKRKELAARMREAVGEKPGPDADERELREYKNRLFSYESAAASYGLPMDALNPVEPIGEATREPIQQFVSASLGGDQVRTADWYGKTTLVSVFSIGSAESRPRLLDLQKLHERLDGDRIRAVVAISVDRDVEAVRRYVERNGLTFPVVVGRDMAEKVGPVDELPRDWLVDAKGNRMRRQVEYSDEGKRAHLMLEMDQLQSEAVMARLR